MKYSEAVIAVRGNHHYGKSHANMGRESGSHSVTCHLAAVTFLLLPQPKLVLDLATPKGCKAELTWVMVISQHCLPNKDGHLSQK